MKPIVILENIRSAYNVGNIIRTADALGYDVILAGFSPSPEENESVKKTSLGAEETVNLVQYWHVQEALDHVRELGYTLIAAEIVAGKSIAVDEITDCAGALCSDVTDRVALVMGNENTGVMEATLEEADHIIHIPMEGMKESLNVGQAAAIMMRECKKLAY